MIERNARKVYDKRTPEKDVTKAMSNHRDGLLGIEIGHAR
jgi:hypothetical protein